MRTPRTMASALAVGVLATVLSAGTAGAADGRPKPIAEQRAAKCAQLQERIAQTPGLQARIQSHIDGIQAELGRIKDPRRRAQVEARLQPRIDKLATLATRIGQQTAIAERLCGAGRT
jgi:hypothetical protein